MKYKVDKSGHCIMPIGILTIAYHEFEFASDITDIEIPDSVTSIDYEAFCGCSSLKAIKIPNSVNSISYGAFYGCAALNSIQVADDNQFYKSVDNCLLSKDGLSLILGCNASIIPNSVTSIGEDAFAGCSRLETIEIPNSVTSIGKYAFAASNLIAITIHEKNPVKAFLLIQNAGFIKEHITLNVPIGTGYAYRHTPFFAKFKMIIAKVR